jgi:hypothetical protein
LPMVLLVLSLKHWVFNMFVSVHTSWINSILDGIVQVERFFLHGSLWLFCVTSLTSLWNANLGINVLVDFWYFLISLKATVPGRYRWGFLKYPDKMLGL